MKRDSFFKESLILTLSNLTTGVLGFMFSIILSKELGAEGMGLYGLIMPIYNLFICLICGGMVTAISKVAAVYFGKNDYRNLNKSIHTSLMFDLIWGTIICIIFFTFSSFISSHVIKDSRTLYSLKVIVPALLFVGLSSILKGYFYGISQVKVPAFIDIFEKAVRIAVIVSVISMLSAPSVTETVTVAYIALCIGEFISLILLYIFYRFNRQRTTAYNSLKKEGRAQLLFDVLVISFPLCLNGFISTGLNTLSTLIVPRRLISAGIEYSTALSLIGKFTGMSMAIIFFPLIVVNSMSTVLIPDLSQTLDKKDYYALENRISQVMQIAFLLGVITLIISISIPDSLGQLFFNRNDLGPYIRFAALSVPLTYTSATTFSILNGLGRQGIVLRNSLIVSIEEVILLYIFTGIPSINIFGYGISLIITSLTLLTLNIIEIKKYCRISFSPAELIIYILLSILIYFILLIANNLIPSTLFALKNIFIITLGFTSYFLCIHIINKESFN
ncbi:stage V sporulation protein B [Clostridium sp. YIM B02515]|uniref:Multidrug-efflux transporter n=1 Tax=Clostridium rhizosphaerae TaxID=2803861 RepID=A0ABS1T9A6_9CLOT|nr:stage V sporulation protein B [Clostridium rhizosphaerae]MBL4935256.1 stage V sporulation protein B [Clostridium rhizosphaerae]